VARRQALSRTPLIGHIIVGLIYGAPIANILAPHLQETFLALGYIGLILIIFEGTSLTPSPLPPKPTEF
jgi:hypothetical protein